MQCFRLIRVKFFLFSVIYFLSVDLDSKKEIAEHCGIVKQTVNTVVHDLEKHGLIEMTPSKTDKRSRIISLTDAGQAYAMEKIGPLLDTEKQICHQIGSDRISSAVETLDLFNVLFERNLNEV